MKYLRESMLNFDDHKNKCRICVEESEVNRQLRVDEEIRSLILELQLELILTRSYSNFICWKCYVNLQQFSSFRSLVNEKQQKLSQFLCRIKSHEQPELLEPSNNDAYEDPLNVETVVVKTEQPENEDLVQKIVSDVECAFCNNRFESHESLQIHIETTHKVEEMSEEMGVDNFFDYSNEPSDVEGPPEALKETKINENSAQTTKGSKNYLKEKCTICGKLVHHKALFAHINQVHYQKKNYFCDLCGKGFYNKAQMRLHAIRHIPMKFRDKKFKCDFCSKTFMCTDYVRIHIKQTHKGRKFTCQCGKSFNKLECLQQHESNKHELNERQTCEICGKVYSHPKALQKHIKFTHTEEGRGTFLCSECGKRFNELASLKVHLLSHSKSFLCDEPGCDKRFAKKSQLKCHTDSIHHLIKNFICKKEGCGKRFWNNIRLQKHIKKTHEKPKVNCPIEGCEDKFDRRDNMKRHLRKKHAGIGSVELQNFIDNLNSLFFNK